MTMARRKMAHVLLALLVTSATGLAAENPGKKSPARATKKAEAPSSLSQGADKASKAKARLPQSASLEGVLVFDSLQSKNRPRMALTFQESAVFKDVASLMGLKTESPNSDPLTPSSPTSQTAPGAEAPKDNPAASRDETKESAGSKTENASAEAAELPVEMGPVE